MKMKTSSRPHGNSVFNIDLLIKSFSRYLLYTRGLAPRTIEEYSKDVEYFLHTQSKKNIINIQNIHPKNVVQFILDDSRAKSASHSQHLTYSLRSFFRFLTQMQHLKVDLANVVPSVANRKKNSYPQVLLPNEITKLLQSCNRLTPAGLRNYAVLMLMVNLGLRSIEVCNLNLDDINWNNGEITIRGKGGEARFPIFQELGKALVAYLKHGRPICEGKKFFIRLKQPLRGFTTSCVRMILRSALKQAGLNPKIKGAHLLRHSFAMQLLEQGATLEEIGMILRHKDVGTTAIYARANFDNLRTIALLGQKQKREGSHD